MVRRARIATARHKIDPWCALMDAATVMARNPAPPFDIAAMIV
jgi:hypothetical protein